MDPTIVNGDIPTLRPNDLNLPAISFSKFGGADSTTRVFKSVDSVASRWTVSFEGLAGIQATASTGQFFTIKPGQTQAIKVSLKEVSAPLNKYTFGSLVLTSGTRTLRVPISIKPVPVVAPAKIAFATPNASGTRDIPVSTSFTGQLSGVGWGLATPDVQAGKRITATSGNPNLSGADPGTQLYPVTVPANSQLISTRITNVDPDSPRGTDSDLDLFLYRDADGDGNFANATLVGVSAGATAEESITLPPFPQAGKYAVAVVGFTTQPGGTGLRPRHVGRQRSVAG